jgi:hypothetical protein
VFSSSSSRSCNGSSKGGCGTPLRGVGVQVKMGCARRGGSLQQQQQQQQEQEERCRSCSCSVKGGTLTLDL